VSVGVKDISASDLMLLSLKDDQVRAKAGRDDAKRFSEAFHAPDHPLGGGEWPPSQLLDLKN